MTDERAEEIRNAILTNGRKELEGLMRRVDLIEDAPTRVWARKYVNALLNNVNRGDEMAVVKILPILKEMIP